MAFQPIPDTASIEVVYNLSDNVNAESRVFATRAGGYDIDALLDLAAAVDDWADTYLVPLMNVNFDYVGVFVRGQEEEIDLQAGSIVNAGAGTLSGQALPNEVSMAVKLLTGLTGRSARGRWFMHPPVVANLQSDNTVNSTYITNIIALLQALKDAIEAVGWVLVIVQRWSEGVKLSAGIPRPVTSVNVGDTILDSQRGRKPQPA